MHRLSEQELKEDLDHILHALWDIHPDSPFYDKIRGNKDIKRNLTSALILDTIWMTDNGVKDQFSASDSKARKVRKLMCYFYYL